MVPELVLILVADTNLLPTSVWASDDSQTEVVQAR